MEAVHFIDLLKKNKTQSFSVLFSSLVITPLTSLVFKNKTGSFVR